MKKTLLTLAALAVTAGAFAESYTEVFPPALNPAIDYKDYKEVGPSAYKFNSGTGDLSFVRADVQSPAAASFQGNNWLSKNCEGESNAIENPNFSIEEIHRGNLVIGGPTNFQKPTLVTSGMSIYDFKGRIGKVFIINGKDSKLNEAIAENFGGDAQELAQVLPQMAEITTNIQLFWILDHIKMREASSFPDDGSTPDNRIRIRFEINGYNNDMTSNKQIFNYLQKVTDTADESPSSTNPDAVYNTSKQVKPLINDFAVRQGDESSDKENYDKTPTDKWNPYRWMVFEIDVKNLYAVSYLRNLINFNMADVNNGAYLIRSIEIYYVGEKDNENRELEKAYVSWNEYPPYDDIKAINIKHSQTTESFDLSAGEKAPLSLEVVTENGEDYDPDTVFEVVLDKNDKEMVTASDITEDKFEVSVAELATLGEVAISVKSGDVKSNEITLSHYAAPSHVELVGAEMDNNVLTLKENDATVEYKLNVVSKHESKEGAYQKFLLEPGTQATCATVALNDKEDSILITPKAVGVTTFKLTPVMAGEYKMETAPKTESREYTVSVGTSGIEILDVTSGEVEYYDLNGRKINNPGNGIFIRKQGDKTTKVILK